MKKSGKEFLVGCLVAFAIGLLFLFGWLMGVLGPFTKEAHFTLLYSFAGGVEVGSPVRVSGIKVGKVDRLEFLPADEIGKKLGATVKVSISVSPKAAVAVKTDSQFYVNMAGIIGERYIEISPGGGQASVLPDGSEVRGIDPPRIDQLLSQGYGVFGRIHDFLEENEKVITDFLAQTNKLMSEANRLLKGDDKRRLFTLIENLTVITDDMKKLTGRLTTKEADETYSQLRTLIQRAHSADKDALKKFFQEEGVRARIF